MPGANATGLKGAQVSIGHSQFILHIMAYRLEKRPMKNEAKAEMAAVAVTRSLLIS